MQAQVLPRHSRTRVGCLTCRSRKKKCDEVKPRCAGCRRNMLECEWPPRVVAGSDSPHLGQAAWLARSHLPVHQSRSSSIPPVVPILYGGTERACALTPHSTILLGHYLEQTASYFAMRPMNDNPFVTILLPLGHMDDLLMHGLLALSGAHLTYKEPDSHDLARATWKHYLRLISGLRGEISSLRGEELEKTERLLRIMLVVCHYEAVSGDTQGHMFNHLRASHYLIKSLLDHKTAKSWENINVVTFGFSIEVYTYLMLSNTIIPHSLAADSALPPNPFVVSLEEMALFPTFGSLFAGSHELFQLIPEISQLASQRLAEEEAGLAEPTAPLKDDYVSIYRRIESWSMPPSPDENNKDWECKRNAAEAYRHALHIYLAASLAGSIVSDSATRASIRLHVIRVFSYTPQLVASQHYVATMMWPIIIAGSCIVKPIHQEALLREARTHWFGIRHLSLFGDILELLWNDPDPRSFGPYGLRLTMEKHGMIIGIA